MSKKKRKKPYKKKSGDKCQPQNIALITAILALIKAVIELLTKLIDNLRD